MTLDRLYLDALKLVNMRRLAEQSRRGYSTLQAYKLGTLRVTMPAARELVIYLRQRAAVLTKAADKLEAAIAREEQG